MTRDGITVSPDMEIVHVTEILLNNQINGVPVLDDNNVLVGIICQSDLISQQKNIPIPSIFTFLEGYIQFTSTKKIKKSIQKIMAITVGDAMTKDPVIVSPDTDIGVIAELMVDKNFHTLPVVEDGKLVGIIGKEDVLQILIKR